MVTEAFSSQWQMSRPPATEQAASSSGHDSVPIRYSSIPARMLNLRFSCANSASRGHALEPKSCSSGDRVLLQSGSGAAPVGIRCCSSRDQVLLQSGSGAAPVGIGCCSSRDRVLILWRSGQYQSLNVPLTANVQQREHVERAIPAVVGWLGVITCSQSH